MIAITLSLSLRIFSSFLSFSDHSLAAKQTGRGNVFSWWQLADSELSGLYLEGVLEEHTLYILPFLRNFPNLFAMALLSSSSVPEPPPRG